MPRTAFTSFTSTCSTGNSSLALPCAEHRDSVQSPFQNFPYGSNRMVRHQWRTGVDMEQHDVLSMSVWPCVASFRARGFILLPVGSAF